MAAFEELSDIEKVAADIQQSATQRPNIYLADQNKIKKIQEDLLRVAPFKIKI